MAQHTKSHVTVNGQTIEVCKIGYDVNGNPRYVVHFLSLGVRPGEYGKIPGLTKYKAKWYGGGYVFYSYSGTLAKDITFLQDVVAKHYSK